MLGWYFWAYRSTWPFGRTTTERSPGMQQNRSLTWQETWMRAPRFMALYLVAFVIGATVGMAGLF